jgi:hypothetical protein
MPVALGCVAGMLHLAAAGPGSGRVHHRTKVPFTASTVASRMPPAREKRTYRRREAHRRGAARRVPGCMWWRRCPVEERHPDDNTGTTASRFEEGIRRRCHLQRGVRAPRPKDRVKGEVRLTGHVIAGVAVAGMTELEATRGRTPRRRGRRIEVVRARQPGAASWATTLGSTSRQR